ncbi:MAG: gamma-glutamyltransferase [Acidimicrobiaceae bacterium]|uniref:gamma-glutamyltransferase n=1 Tax=Candidatus Poriferisodalis multihospitum TaxID=2983191 RepID=UPI0022A54FF1|nr:gamma-glutamyltransferase [Candidatus Poriferisodalis multihospitum]MCY3607024.1 gamma-glutamyltransferase [Acidimicrobiaceae bacterium]MCY3893497.1 gamma-glutamyltransferase [Acidimicrobiaceae bacterium]MCY3948628.1 gamma-glutamyltransferase [Acidimicrobiaceae bacterium]MDE0677154.1 gamma-glutamyltransferase [Acidimicrobiaceae bacterium]
MSRSRPQVPFATRHARNGMVCTVDHLASDAGVSLLRAGGSAADAAVAASAVLAVTTQHMCGMGGDLWALVHHADGTAPAALNASGRAGSGADPDALRAEGRTRMRFRNDIRSVPVPGCVDGWLSLHERYGRVPLAEVLAPAIDFASGGFPLSPHGAAAAALLDGVANTDDYSPQNRPGDLISRPGVAAALHEIVVGGREAYYEGGFGRDLIELGSGEYTTADLARSQADWVTPLQTDAWGHRLWTVPPNSQGYLTLAGAWIAAGLELPADPDDPLFAHLLAEAAKQAGWDRPAVLSADADGAALVAPERLAPRRAAISPDAAAPLGAGTGTGDTMYLAAVDDDRMGVSLIQSNAGGWGIGLWTPTHRISLHNRGIGFNLVEGHAAEYRPGRRPPHTLAPAIVQRADGSLRSVVGTMGGDAQPQVLLQVLARSLCAGEEPASAIGSGRWRWGAAEGTGFDTWADPGNLQLYIEGHAAWAGPDGLADLTGRGHRVGTDGAHDNSYGHAHLIEVHDSVLAGASDPRALTGGVAGY